MDGLPSPSRRGVGGGGYQLFSVNQGYETDGNGKYEPLLTILLQG